MSDALAGILPGTTGQADQWAPGVAGSAGLALGTGTGQHGLAPLEGELSGNPFTNVWRWLNTPFTTPMSPVDVALLVGVVLISVLLWNLILFHVRIAAESI